MRAFIKNWWNGLRFEPTDPRYRAGGVVRITAIGGGTGLSTLLRGLKEYSDRITAVVAVTDDGSSSGVIRREFDILPPGDLRKCISALAYDEEMISKLLEYRFEGGNDLSGHTLGNIWITALSKYFGSFELAIEVTTELFQTAGKVMPVTLDKTGLGAIYENGKKVIGESRIAHPQWRIREVYLTKKNVAAYQSAVSAINEADMIVLGPGSLYTSVIPNLLIPEIRRAIIANQEAVKVFVVNCSTERGETENYTIEDHIRAIEHHAGKRMFNYCLVNNRVIKRSQSESELGEINNITTNETMIKKYRVVSRDVVNESNPLYHDSAKLAKSLINLYNQIKR